MPQSTTADRMNLGLWRVWKEMELPGKCQLLAQTYDSITLQYPEEREDEVLHEALERIQVALARPDGRSYIVPGDAKVGWNWGPRVGPEDQDKARQDGKSVPRLNADGLVKWRRGKRDGRVRTKWKERELSEFALG
jgi:hypothetical protein